MFVVYTSTLILVYFTITKVEITIVIVTPSNSVFRGKL